jgi:nucleotide-binding universal stress UspA family protein
MSNRGHSLITNQGNSIEEEIARSVAMRTQTTSSQQEIPKAFQQSSAAESSRPGLATQRHLNLKTIAVLTDLGDGSEKPLHYAASLARWYGSKLLIAHMSPRDVYSYTWPQPFPAWPAGVLPLKENPENKIDSLISKAGLQDLTTEVVINESTIGDLLRDVEGRRPDLLVLTAHGREGIRKLLIGSITEEVFRRVERPVLVLGPHTLQQNTPPVEFRRVLCAIDLSAASANALRYALALAEDHDAQLTVAHIETGAMDTFDPVTILRKVHDYAYSHVPAQTGALARINYTTRLGLPEDKILELAKECRADLIVVGARGLGAAAGIASHFVGGTAYEVATRSDCPVLIVPRPR